MKAIFVLWVLLSFMSCMYLVFAQSPRVQIATNPTPTHRTWVVSKRMAARMHLWRLDDKGIQYATQFVLGEDGEKYALDDVLAGTLEILDTK